MRPVIKEVVKLVRSSVDRNDVTIHFEFDNAVPTPVLADRSRLSQVLPYLVNNAIKLSESGGFVHVKCENIADNTVRVSIAYTGQSIRETNQTKLIEPFGRLSNKISGIDCTGIWLTIAKLQVEAMGGAIKFESVEEYGCTIWIDLPFESG
jgi:signal transduction histidine kinase